MQQTGDNDHRGAPDPAVRVSRLGYVGFRTPDLDRLVDYYANALDFAVVERSAKAAYLTTHYDHHCVVIEAGEALARTRVGFQIRGELGDAAKRLKAAGVASELRTDPEPGIAAALVIEEPDGTPLHLYEAQAPSGEQPKAGARPSKLGHVASFVPGIKEIQSFYEQILGFRWSDTVGDFFVFMRCGPDHHAVNFLARPGLTQGMHHIAYEARDIAHLKDILDNIAKHGCKLLWGIGRHGAGHNVFSYHLDPDDNRVEIFTDLDVIYDEETGYYEPRPWHEMCPMGPQIWDPPHSASNMWGILAPPTM